MTQEANQNTPYDQNEAFAELEDLVAALEVRWAARQEGEG